jgi:hypothetical protein
LKRAADLYSLEVSFNSPRFTSDPSQIRQKNTFIKTGFFAKPPYKNSLSLGQKKLTIFAQPKW